VANPDGRSGNNFKKRRSKIPTEVGPAKGYLPVEHHVYLIEATTKGDQVQRGMSVPNKCWQIGSQWRALIKGTSNVGDDV